MTDTVVDLPGKPPGPALSATSDMPTIAAAAADAEAKSAPEVKTDATPNTTEAKPSAEKAADTENRSEAKAEEATGEVAETTEAVAETKPAKQKPNFGERLSEVTAQRKAAEQRAAQLTDSLEKALSAIDKLTAKPAGETAITVAATDPRPVAPKREAFDSPEAWDAALATHHEALVTWSAREGVRVGQAEAEKKALEQKAADERVAVDKRNEEERSKIAADWTAKRTKALEKYDDYAEIAESDDVTIAEPMARAIMAVENGPDLAYYLGKNREEAARIAALNPVQQIFEMGQLSAKLATPKPQVSRTPPPIKPLGSNQSAAPKSPADMTMEEYGAWRTPKLQAERRGHH